MVGGRDVEVVVDVDGEEVVDDVALAGSMSVRDAAVQPQRATEHSRAVILEKDEDTEPSG